MFNKLISFFEKEEIEVNHRNTFRSVLTPSNALGSRLSFNFQRGTKDDFELLNLFEEKPQQNKFKRLPDSFKYSACSELNEYQSKYIIDIARPTQSMDEILQYLNENIEINIKGKGGTSPGFTDGMKHDKEMAELIFPLIDQIVTQDKQVEIDYSELIQVDDMNEKDSIDNRLIWSHFPNETDYTQDSLVQSIETILMYQHEDQNIVQKRMDQLRHQVSEMLQHMLSYRVQNEISWKVHCYALAIQFYIGYFEQYNEDGEFMSIDEEESYRILTDQVRQSQQPDGDDDQKIYKFKKQLVEVIWWVNQALILQKPFKGECEMEMYLDPEQFDLGYFQFGKIFKFQNIIQANYGVDKKMSNMLALARSMTEKYELSDPKSKEPRYSLAESLQIQEIGEAPNIKFHIYSQEGRQVYEFLAPDSKLEAKAGTKVLFKSGSEFMICKIEEGTEELKILHVYLREIVTGLAKNTVIWCDNRMNTQTLIKYQNWVRLSQEENQKNIDTHYVHKVMTQYAKAYFESPIFQAVLLLSENIQFIQNLERSNDKNITYKQQKVLKCEGPRLLYDFLTISNDGLAQQEMEYQIQPPHLTKIQIGIFPAEKYPKEEDIQQVMKDNQPNSEARMIIENDTVSITKNKDDVPMMVCYIKLITEIEQLAQIMNTKLDEHHGQFKPSFGATMKLPSVPTINFE